MSLSGHFNSKWVKQDKLGRNIKTHEDFRTARIRHADGSHAMYRAGQIVPGTHETPKHVAKVDVPTAESKFFKETPISTILETRQQGEKESIGEKDSAARVRKPIDVNRSKLKL